MTDHHLAYRWRDRRLMAIEHPQQVELDELLGIDTQKALLQQNTAQFVAGRPANHALLTGARGTGKSSLLRALLNRYAADGLRVIEVQRDHLVDLPDILQAIRSDTRYAALYFIIFCDDLTFSDEEPAYKALKTALDGSLAAPDGNVLIYATSNRRHLLPEYMQDNLAAQMVDGELHPGEAIEEKVSLSERFGLWLAFYPFTQDEYLAAVGHWLQKSGITLTDEMCIEACAFATQRGSRSGRVAVQFARDMAGRLQLYS